METLFEAYKDRSVHFWYVKSREPHPGFYGYHTSSSLQERLEQVRLVKRELNTRIPWIIDGMDNKVQRLYGRLPNSEFVIGADGKLISKRQWANPEALRDELARLVGPADLPADVWKSDPTEARARRAGWLPRSYADEVPPAEKPPSDELTVLSVKPIGAQSVAGKPIKLSLTAELFVEPLGGRKAGRLYLTLRLPQGRNLHWNNLSGPQLLRLSEPGGIKFEKAELKTGQRRAESDPLDRIFAVTWYPSAGDDGRISFKASLEALICDDKEGWCAPFTARYVVEGTIPPSAR